MESDISTAVPSEKEIQQKQNVARVLHTNEWHKRRAKECVTYIQTWLDELLDSLPHVVAPETHPKHDIMLRLIHSYLTIFVPNDDENDEAVDYRNKMKDNGNSFLLNKHLTLAVFEELAYEKKENIVLRKAVRQIARDVQHGDDNSVDYRIEKLKDSLDNVMNLNDQMKAQQIKMSADIYALLQQQQILDRHIENTEIKLQKMASDNSRYKHMIDHFKTKRNGTRPSTQNTIAKPYDDVQPRPPSSNGIGTWSRPNKLLTIRHSPQSNSADKRSRGSITQEAEVLIVKGSHKNVNFQTLSNSEQ